MLFGGGTSTNDAAADSPLRPIPTSRNALELEIVFAERPVGDPLLGSALWDEIDELTIQPELRRSLRRHGFLTGVCGAAPPRALQSLLGLVWDVPDEDKRLVGRRIVLPSGGQTDIPTSYYRAEREIAVPVAGSAEMQLRAFPNGRCVLTVRAEHLQEGFARVEFLPEIHFGELINRPTATATDWQYQARQKVERLYDQRFSVDLNIGEMAVVTTDAADPQSLGHHFFVVSGDDGGERKIQRVLVVRLAGMAAAEAERSR